MKYNFNNIAEGELAKKFFDDQQIAMHGKNHKNVWTFINEQMKKGEIEKM